MMRTPSLPSRRCRTGCSVLALATVLVAGASPAAAQSFQGSGTITSGSGSITTGPGTTTITVSTPQTVVDWTPTDNAIANNTPIAFQSSGTTASFAGSGNFAVLNRINPADSTRGISLNGTIQAIPSGAAVSANGSIYFYSPGGFIIGANAVINVGSLVLSASPITVNASGNFINGAENSVIFGPALHAGASITTSATSQITASGGDAYVAMVAPRVVHGGTITVAGSAALVGAEAATINFSPDGLFDIQVTTGTTDANGVANNGNITGTASGGAADNRRAFLVAVPKNTALTLAIGNGSDLGFDIAGSANVSGNAVILSAGHDIVNGEIGAVSSAAGALADILVSGLNATSGVRAAATNFAEFNVTGATTSSNYASDLEIRAPGRAWVSTFGAGKTLTVGRDLILNSDRVASAAGGSATGGSAALYAGDNGTIMIGRDATVSANGVGGNSSTSGLAGGIGTGGFATIQNQAAGSSITVGRNALVSANGIGGSGLVAGANGGAGTGGTATIRSFANGTSLAIGGTATAQALGTGGSALNCAGCIGGNGTGGTVLVNADIDSLLSVTGMLRMSADGRAGSLATGRGGTVDLFAGVSSTLTAGSLNATADGHGGADIGVGAGNGVGGTASIRASGADSSISITNVVTGGVQNDRDFLSAEGFGGHSNGGGTAIAGTGTGGTLLIQGQNGATITLPNSASVTDLRISGRGTGGRALVVGSTGGLGRAGLFNLSLDNATLTAGQTHITMFGFGGESFATGTAHGGDGIGGTRNISAVNGSTLSIGLGAGIAGGGGGSGTGSGNGGNGTGGTSTLLVDNSTVNFTSRSFLSAGGSGGAGVIAGNGTAGTATVTVRNGGIINVADDPTTTADFDISSTTFGGDFFEAPGAQGGNAVAGTTTLLLDGGTINLTGNMSLGASAFGGDAGSIGGVGGNATAGTVNVIASGANSLITGPGSLSIQASGFGGWSPAGVSGNATGGTISITAQGGTLLTIQSPLSVRSEAIGGTGETGGNATGGSIYLRALSGGDINLTGAGGVTLSTDATGGNGDDGNGGNAVGGNATEIYADGTGSTLTIAGPAAIGADASGGNSNLLAGGNASGGNVSLYAQNGGNLNFMGSVSATANANAGTGGSAGGTAFNSGDVAIFSTAMLHVGGSLYASALSFGGGVFDNDVLGLIAGNATGGRVNVYAQNGTMDLDGAVTLTADGTGGGASGFNDRAGNGTGGESRLIANAGGSIDLGSTLASTAVGRGGQLAGSGAFGGSGQGGAVRLQATAANAAITVAGAVMLDASGNASNGGECFSCGNGGNGTGGTAWIDSFGAASASLTLQSDVTALAQGRGGGSFTGTAGNGQGGQAVIHALAGSTQTIGGNAVINTDGFGGVSNAFLGGIGGNGVGGHSFIQADSGGGTIAIAGGAVISANGQGGASTSFADGRGGNGTGGMAQLYATPGTITIGTAETNGGVSVSADGTGGNADNGTGGNGTGGSLAEIAVVNGDITIAGFAAVSASGAGGNGLFGGNGLGSGTPPTATAAGFGGAHIFAQNGDIVINGGAGVFSTGTGGDGGFDNNGYNSDNGGDGGHGTGGWATIFAANSNLGPSLIRIDSGSLETSGQATVDVSGRGGDGGNGASGNAGGDGGNGGNGFGGTGSITAAAGNGMVDIGVARGNSTATGGTGGGGGNGDGQPGGNGGNGGNATGGVINIGTSSGSGQSGAVNNGVGTYGSILADASALGGSGGNGNFGSVGGAGGNGGNAINGGAVLLVRGSRVNADNVILTANATGGNGGLGGGETAPDGNGGNATVGGEGGIAVLVTDRFQIPAQRGTLDAGSINGTAIATGGTGEIDGASQTLGGNLVVFRRSDGMIGSLDFLVQADSIGLGAIEDAIAVYPGGTVTVDGAFNFVTSGSLSLLLDNSTLTANTIRWHAADFVPDTVTVTPAVPGTFFANSFDIQTGNNFLTTAHLDSVATLTIVAPGAIQIGNVSGDNSIVLAAQGAEIDIGNVLAGGGVDLDADDFVATGNVVANGVIDVDAGSSIGMGTILNTGNTSLNAGSSINVGSINSGAGSVSLVTNTSSISGDIVAAGSIYADSGDDIFLSNLTAPGDIELVAVGDILVGNAVAGQTVDLDAGGYIDGGTMTAGDSVYASADGSIDLLNVSAGIGTPSLAEGAEYNVGLLAGTTIVTGDIAAANSIGLGAVGNIRTGSINAGNIFLALGGGTMSFGAIDAGGTVYLADDSMIALGGDPADGDFDPALILAATPVASGGSIELRAAVTAGRFEAAAGTTLTGTTINSNGLLYATSGGNMTLGNLSAGNDVRLTSGANIVTGSIGAGDDVALVATGSISTLDIFAYDDVSADAGSTISTDDITGSSIDLFADGAISTDNLLTRDFFFAEGFQAAQLVEGASITVQSGANVATGNIDSKDGVHVSADGSISSGTIDAGTFVELFAGGNITAGTINAGSYVDVFSDNGLIDLDDLNAGGDIELDTGGAIVFGNVTAREINFDAGGSVNGGNIVASAHADGHAEGALTLKDITVTGPPTDGDDFSIGFTSATSITVENVDGFDRVGFATLGNLTTGNIVGGSLVLGLAGGDIVTGSITTDAGGRVYMANASMCGGACGDDDDESDVEAEDILALAPVPTGGSITISGPVVTGRFQAAAGENLATRAITAQRIEASAGETAAIDGAWRAPTVSLASGNINITANGSIDAGTNGLITLNAVSTEGDAMIGDGLTGSGYALSNAEFGRISGGTIRIVVGGNGGDADTLIGDLTITGPLAGSNIESNGGGVEFITLQEDGAGLDGTLRIVGDVVATGFGAQNYLGFYTQNFELDAATGSISITSSGNALAGILEIFASRIHVAEGSLLNKLAANPQFAGYREALNKPAATQRPEGVIRAASFDIDFVGSDVDGPYTLFVQNMGTAAVPAGFLLNAADIGEDGESELASGSIDLAINGQINGEGGTLTGIAVRDLLVTEFGTSAFVAGSTINGCPLTGGCTTAPPKVDTPTRTDIALSNGSGLGDGLFGNEGDIDDGESGDGGERSSPIAPPNPLFDSRPLTAAGDVDDPISGAGNPSLYGTSDEDDDEEEDEEKKKAKAKQGDGK